ncbi:hypothetical protein ACLK19_15755 [Escherichia coli]
MRHDSAVKPGAPPHTPDSGPAPWLSGNPSGLPLDAIARYSGQLAALDAQCGVLAINPNDAVQRLLSGCADLAQKRQKQQAQGRLQPAYSRDSKRIDIAANIGTALEAPACLP